MGIRQGGADGARRVTAVDQIIDDQKTLAGAGGCGWFDNAGGGGGAGFLGIADDADAFDQADFQLACHDGGGNQAAAGDGDDAGKFVSHEGGGQRPCVTVQLVPCHGRVMDFRFQGSGSRLVKPSAVGHREIGA